MKNWSAVEWCLIIMALSVSFAILQPAIIRITTGQALSDNTASVLNTYTQSIGTGILSIAAMILGKRWADKKES